MQLENEFDIKLIKNAGAELKYNTADLKKSLYLLKIICTNQVY